MSVKLNQKTRTWEVQAWAKDAFGRRRKVHKRGFATRDEAIAWEASERARNDCGRLTVSEFWEVYRRDVFPTLKPSTRVGKDGMFRSRIEPAFGAMRMGSVSAADVVAWRNMLVADGCSPTYMRTLRNQLAAMFNHAVRIHGLPESPVAKAGPFGSKEAAPRKVWDRGDYETFSCAVMDKPDAHMAFEVLYWCGQRKGELLALTPDDVDFACGEISVTKSYARLGGKDVVSAPKTPQSVRRVAMPMFLEEELVDYLRYRGIEADERIFPYTGCWLAHEMRRGCTASGVEPIRIHDLRHSHVSLLVQEGLSVVDIAGRMGHTAIDITLRYARLLPGRQAEIAARLDGMRDGRPSRAGRTWTARAA